MTTALQSLRDSMVAELSRANHNGVQNSLKAIGLLHPKIRNQLIAVMNRYEDLSRGLAGDEITQREAMQGINQIIESVGKLMLDNATRDADAAPPIDTPKFKGDLLHLNPWMPPDLSKSIGLLKTYSADKARIDRVLATDSHVITWAPVLPLVQPGLNVELLNKRGFQAENLEGYAVLSKQLVIGVAIDEVNMRVNAYDLLVKTKEDVVSMGMKANKSAGSKYEDLVLHLYNYCREVLPEWKADPTTYAKIEAVTKARTTKGIDAFDNIMVKAHELAGHLSELLANSDRVTEESLFAQFTGIAKNSIGRQLAPVGPIITYKNTRWMWLMNPKEFTMLSACAYGGHFKLNRWTLAFSGA